jgi:hypothetical protein
MGCGSRAAAENTVRIRSQDKIQRPSQALLFQQVLAWALDFVLTPYLDPCDAFGNTGEGCANSGGSGGARLAASGTASLSEDSFIQYGVRHPVVAQQQGAAHRILLRASTSSFAFQ